MAERLLFTPMKIGSCEIKNRIVMAPMLMGFGQFNGKPTAKMMDYYEARAKGGTGLIITEITRVNDKTGAAAFAQLSVSSDDHIAPLSELAPWLWMRWASCSCSSTTRAARTWACWWAPCP